MRIVVCDRGSAAAGTYLESPVPHVVVSIRDPGSDPVQWSPCPDRLAVLELAFADAIPHGKRRGPAEPGLMSAADARAVWDFVRRHRRSVGTLVIHCELGWSRSPAVAAALAWWLGEDGSRFFEEYRPNLFVYRLMLRTRPR